MNFRDSNDKKRPPFSSRDGQGEHRPDKPTPHNDTRRTSFERNERGDNRAPFGRDTRGDNRAQFERNTRGDNRAQFERDNRNTPFEHNNAHRDNRPHGEFGRPVKPMDTPKPIPKPVRVEPPMPPKPVHVEPSMPPKPVHVEPPMPIGEHTRKPMPPKHTAYKTARDAALNALQDVVRCGAYAAQALSRQLEDDTITPEDKRLAANIFYCAAENRLRISYALGKFLEMKPDPITEDILHIAAAQILFMSRIPDHAAVDEAVKQTRALGREGLTGLVNGVLRSLLRARDAGDTLLPERMDDPLSYLSIRYSVAPHIVEKLARAYGEELTEQIIGFAQDDRTRAVVRPNLMRISPEEFAHWLDQRTFHWKHSRVQNAFILNHCGDLSYLDGYKRGYFSMQGESSMLAAYACMPKPGMQILDACAAPGGKSALLCEELRGTGRVFAWDVHDHRVELIRAAGRRLGLDNLRPTTRDARMPYPPFEYNMDVVLVDAPCSGLGVISDKPDIKYRLKPETLDELIPLQKDILENCASFVKVGGLLVYSTCTILPEENILQVQNFLERHPEFVPDLDDSWLPVDLRGAYHDGMAQFLSCRDGVEGFFIARMRRRRI